MIFVSFVQYFLDKPSGEARRGHRPLRKIPFLRYDTAAQPLYRTAEEMIVEGFALHTSLI